MSNRQGRPVFNLQSSAFIWMYILYSDEHLLFLYFIFYYIVFALFSTYIISFSPLTLFFPISTFSYVSYFMRLSLIKMTIKKAALSGRCFLSALQCGIERACFGIIFQEVISLHFPLHQMKG